MATEHRISVTRPGRGAGTWVVRCSACTSNDLLGTLFGGFARTQTHADALGIANWFARLHAERTCDSCGEVPRITPVRPADGQPGMFTHEGTMYQLIDGQVYRYEAVTA